MKPYNSDESKKKQVEAMFDSIALRYDLLNRVLSLEVDRYWRWLVARDVKRFADTQQAVQVLDVATGTADLAIRTAKTCRKCHITGVDLSANMLEIGKRKVEQKNLTDRIELQQVDAEALPFTDQQFDIVTVAFGVRNFENLSQGLSEMNRVVRTGGQIVVLEFGMPHNKILGTIYRFYFHGVLPQLGKWISRDRKAYTYLPESVEEFPYGEKFVQLLNNAGFKQISTRNLFGGVAQIYCGKKIEL